MTTLDCRNMMIILGRGGVGDGQGGVPSLAAKNLLKITKKLGKKRKNREEKAKVGKVLSGYAQEDPVCM